MADCEHNGRHLHCNICGGAPCAECFGSIAPSPDAFGMRRGPNIELVYQNKIAALRAKLDAWEKAMDAWMVVNWVGVYDKSKGVSETLSLCLERALDIERDQLRAKLEAAERDAERYRWLESKARKNTAYDIYKDGCGWYVGFSSRDAKLTFDAAIDSARGGERG